MILAVQGERLIERHTGVSGTLGTVQPWRKSCRMESLEWIGSCSILREEEMRVCRAIEGARG